MTIPGQSPILALKSHQSITLPSFCRSFTISSICLSVSLPFSRCVEDEKLRGSTCVLMMSCDSLK